MISDYKQLQVWQKSMELARQVYKITERFPKEEVFGLTSQMRRAAVSVPSNIAEGSSRTGTKEFIQFLAIARGSAAELETQVILASELGYCPDTSEILSLITSVRQLMNGLIRSLKERL